MLLTNIKYCETFVCISIYHGYDFGYECSVIYIKIFDIYNICLSHVEKFKIDAIVSFQTNLPFNTKIYNISMGPIYTKACSKKIPFGTVINTIKI